MFLFLSKASVPYAYGSVLRRRNDSPAIGGDGDRGNRSRMRATQLQGRRFASVAAEPRQRPRAHAAVCAASDDETAIRRDAGQLPADREGADRTAAAIKLAHAAVATGGNKPPRPAAAHSRRPRQRRDRRAADASADGSDGARTAQIEHADGACVQRWGGGADDLFARNKRATRM